LDAPTLAAELRAFAATHVVHLAARADLDERDNVSAYAENTVGVSNLLAAIQASTSVQRLIVTSSQMVCQPGYWPSHDEDFSPNSVYGESKIITERLVREGDPPCIWTIIRPMNIWGPWLRRHSDHFYALVRRGLYWHPSGRSARRCWGYVGNVAYQIQRILELPAEQVHGQVLYVGDAPFALVDWVNAVSMRLTGRPAKTAPRSFFRILAALGDIVQRCGLRAPITTLRYKAMIEDYLAPIERTLELVGRGPYSMEQGIEETVRWLNNGGSRPAAPKLATVMAAEVETQPITSCSTTDTVALEDRGAALARLICNETVSTT
jgi:nucleoside-diphosphate-sugar epimerase